MNHGRIVTISAIIALTTIVANIYLGEQHQATADSMPLVWALLGVIALSVGTLTWALVNSNWFPTHRPVYRGGILILITALLLAFGAWVNALRLWLL